MKKLLFFAIIFWMPILAGFSAPQVELYANFNTIGVTCTIENSDDANWNAKAKVSPDERSKMH